MSIDGLAFVACSRALKFFSYKTYFGLYLQSIQTAEIIDCTFQDSYGTALGVVDSRVVLRDDNFLNNCLMCSNGSCVFNLFQFYECHGGGVYIEESDLTITGSNSFFGNNLEWRSECSGKKQCIPP